MKHLKSLDRAVNIFVNIRVNMVKAWFIFTLVLLAGCNNTQQVTEEAVVNGIDPNSAIYEVAVQEGVSYEDVVESLKSLSEGMNFVNPANFPIAENMKKRDIDPQGIKEVHTFCNLAMGTEIILDHPEFLVFAPCRIAIYEKPDENKKMQLYLGLDRPTYDLKSIKNPTERAQKSAQALEDALINLMQKASEGDF